MSKRLTEKQKKEIVKLFISGINIDQISHQFNCTKLTISRNLKNNLDEITYKDLLAKSKSNNKLPKNKRKEINNSTKDNSKVNPKTNKNYKK